MSRLGMEELHGWPRIPYAGVGARLVLCMHLNHAGTHSIHILLKSNYISQQPNASILNQTNCLLSEMFDFLRKSLFHLPKFTLTLPQILPTNVSMKDVSNQFKTLKPCFIFYFYKQALLNILHLGYSLQNICHNLTWNIY